MRTVWAEGFEGNEWVVTVTEGRVIVSKSTFDNRSAAVEEFNRIVAEYNENDTPFETNIRGL